MFYIINENTINFVGNTKNEVENLIELNNFFKDKKLFEIEDDITNYKIEENEIIPKTDVDLLQEKLEEIKQKKLAELTAYDSSTAVNSFTINGIEMWLNKEERNSLYRLATACKNMGLKTMPLQLADGTFVEFPPNNVLMMLDELEVYAGASFGVTGNKKIEIKAITTTIEEIEAYDVTTGYPKKLNF